MIEGVNFKDFVSLLSVFSPKTSVVEKVRCKSHILPHLRTKQRLPCGEIRNAFKLDRIKIELPWPLLYIKHS